MSGVVQHLAETSRYAKRIHFLGYREDTPKLLNLFEIFCLPSIYEGMPLSILEAMAAGVPVVGADVMGINEVLIDGKNGLLFRSNSDQDLAAKLSRLLNDCALRQRLSTRGRIFVHQHYALKKKIMDYQKLFLRLI